MSEHTEILLHIQNRDFSNIIVATAMGGEGKLSLGRSILGDIGLRGGFLSLPVVSLAQDMKDKNPQYCMYKNRQIQVLNIPYYILN